MKTHVSMQQTSRRWRGRMLRCLTVCLILTGGDWAKAGEVCDPRTQVCFQGIGQLENGFSSFAKDIAYVDGVLVVLGSAASTPSASICAGMETVKYVNGQLRPVHNTAALGFCTTGESVALANGKTFISGTAGPIDKAYQAVQLGDELVAPVLLPMPTGFGPGSNGGSLSDDGGVIVGTVRGEFGPVGVYKWTRSTNTSFLIPPLNSNISPQGSGDAVSPNGLISGGQYARTSTFLEGFLHPGPGICLPSVCSSRGIGDLPGGIELSRVTGITNTGRVLATGHSSAGSEAFFWFPGNLFPSTPDLYIPLGDLPGGVVSTVSGDISGDGTLVTAMSSSAARPSGEPALWHADLGMRSLRAILEDNNVTGLEGWTLQTVEGMSTNGLAICGYGINAARPGSGSEGWFITLPDCNENGIWDELEPPLPSAGAARTVLAFDGINDLVEQAAPSASLKITGPLTVEAWIYLHRLGVNQSIITMGAAGESLDTNVLYSVAVDPVGDVVVMHERSNLADVVVVADTNLQTGRWYHLAVTRTFFSSSTLEYSVYVDGLDPIIEGAGGAPAGGASGRLRIGHGEGSVPDRPFDGLIADVRIWDVARTAEEIRGSMLTPVPADAVGLVASWTMDEPSGATLLDGVGSNDVTLFGNPPRVSVDADCNGNGIPDSCETDCNENGIPDDCDISNGISCDSDGNGTLDECEISDMLADLFSQEAATEVFRTGRDRSVNPTTFGTMVQIYGRPWKPGTGQTAGGGVCSGGPRNGLLCNPALICPNGTCDPPAGTGILRDPAERLRAAIHDPGCLPVETVQKVLNELFAFEMLLGNEAFADAMDPTVGEGVLLEGVSLEQIPGLFAFNGLPATGSLLSEELVLLRGREITLPASSDLPLNDDPASNLNGNYPQFDEAARAAIYNRLRPNAGNTLGSVAYRSNYNKTSNGAAAESYPQGHGDAYGFYLTATKLYLRVFGATSAGVASDVAGSFIESQVSPESATDCDGIDCETVLDDDGITHTVPFHSVRNMAVAMAARARSVNRIVDLTFRQDYREDIDTQLGDPDAARAWGLADWARRGGVGAYLDWAALNHMLPATEPGSIDELADVHRERVDELRFLASAVTEMQERVDAAGAGLNPLGLVPNVVPFRIIQPGQLLDFLQGGASAGKSHYGIVRDAAVEAIRNARGILQRANVGNNRLLANETSFASFEDQVRETDIGFNNRLIEIFGLPSPDDHQDNDFEDNNGNGVHDPEDDFIESGCNGGCAGSPDLLNFLVDAQVMEELGLAPRPAVGLIQLAMFELRTASLRVQSAELAIANLEALIQDKAENVALTRDEAVEQLEIRAHACADQIKVIDRKESLAKARKQRGILGRVTGVIIGGAVCLNTGFACGSTKSAALGLAGSLLGDMFGNDSDEQFNIEQEEIRINCWQTAELTRISNDQSIRALEIELEDLIRRTPQAILELVVADTQAKQALAVVQKNFQEGKRLLEERDRIRRVQADKLQDFRFRDMAFRVFRNQALEQYGAFFDLASRYVMLAARAFAYEYNERQEVDNQVRALYRERLLGTETATDRGLESIIARLDQKRQESDFNARLQKLSLFDQNGDEFSLRKNLLGLAINPATDTAQQQLEKNKAFRAFLESSIVQDLREVPAFAQFASLDSSRDAGPAIVLTFSTEVAGRTLFGKRRGTTFGAPANFDTCSNPKVFEFAILLEGVDNPSALGVDGTLIFAHFLPVGSSMLRAPTTGDCSLRAVRTWAVVDQRIPGVASAYRDTGTAILDIFDMPRLETSEELYLINRFPATHAQIRQTDSPVFQDELAGWSVWNTQWLLAIPGRQFTDPNDSVSEVRRKLLILIFDADQNGNPRDPNQNLGIDDIKLRIKAYGKPS